MVGVDTCACLNCHLGNCLGVHLFVCSLACSRMYATAAARSDGLLLLCGGRDASGVPLADAYGFARHRDGRWEWHLAPGAMPAGRYQHGAVFVGARLHISGGAVGGGRTVDDATSTVILDTSGGAWCTPAPNTITGEEAVHMSPGFLLAPVVRNAASITLQRAFGAACMRLAPVRTGCCSDVSCAAAGLLHHGKGGSASGISTVFGDAVANAHQKISSWKKATSFGLPKRVQLVHI